MSISSSITTGTAEAKKRLSLTSSINSLLISGTEVQKGVEVNNAVLEKICSLEKLTIKVVGFTRAGKTPGIKNKTNQDAYKYYCHNNGELHMFLVCDGHGAEGEKVSNYITENFPSFLLKHFPKVNSSGAKNKLQTITSGEIISIIEKAFISFDKEILNQKFDTHYSGSTFVLCIIFNNTLYTANVGDSRAILLPTDTDNLKSVDKSKVVSLTVDLKPDLPAEKARIEEAGGVVSKFCEGEEYFNGDEEAPYRVWLKGKSYPGLAMARAMGDGLVKSVGVIADPEISVTPLKSKSCQTGIVLMASDGVWEFMSNKEALDNLGKVDDKNVQKLVEMAKKKWKKYSGDTVIDDITALLFSYKSGSK